MTARTLGPFMTLPHGLYDLLLTEAIQREISASDFSEADLRDLSNEEVVDRLIEAVGIQLRRILADAADRGREVVADRVALLNGLLSSFRERATTGASESDSFTIPPKALFSFRPSTTPPPTPPETGLSSPWLFTAGKGSPAMVTELRREAAAADEIDILVSFITNTGVRKLIDVLKTATAAGASGKGRTRIRVLTTTYMAATQQHAIDQLARLNGSEVRVSLDGRRTRLHAKAWIFKRVTGFGSAYVGSANLSGAALMGGLEWTVKFTERGQGALFERAKAHFDTLWLDDEFTPYDPEDADSRRLLAEALLREGGQGSGEHRQFFDIQPKPYQREMLADLRRERELGRTRNLVVSATGTGKTVLAALDYRSTADELSHRPRLLFVAHRAQILRQALRTYREVLRDHSFGEVLSGGGAAHPV